MLAATPLLAQAPSAAPTTSLLSQRIAALTSSGRLGVAAQDLETGHTVSLSGADPFPMASTVKVAIAAVFLAGVDSGRYSLDQMYGQGRRAVSASRLLGSKLSVSRAMTRTFTPPCLAAAAI